LALDDTVVWGALSLLAACPTKPIAELAERLLRRRLYIAVNASALIAEHVHQKHPLSGDEGTRVRQMSDRREDARRYEALLRERVRAEGLLKYDEQGAPVLEDVVDRDPYKRVETEDGALSRIWALGDDQQLYDLADLSPVVRALLPFHAYRLYCRDESARDRAQRLISEVLQ
jgi:hypothetical protein